MLYEAFAGFQSWLPDELIKVLVCFRPGTLSFNAIYSTYTEFLEGFHTKD